MMWLDDLREELQHRQIATDRPMERFSKAESLTSSDANVARADVLVRTLQDQMNQTLLGGRGSVWNSPAEWGEHLWELWWEPTRERGPYIVVVLLYDSRGTPYLKVQGRRLALDDALIERRLQRALRAAFLAPHVYTPHVHVPEGPQELLQPAPENARRTGTGQSNVRRGVSETHGGMKAGDPGKNSWAAGGEGTDTGTTIPVRSGPADEAS
ncbi:MAG: hypothetical protein JWO42_1098 [Chloroflexi bacterium]|jgi:hypothetical protein|nr:hypothetical protein [Chloroflexota bacterium]